MGTSEQCRDSHIFSRKVQALKQAGRAASHLSQLPKLETVESRQPFVDDSIPQVRHEFKPNVNLPGVCWLGLGVG